MKTLLYYLTTTNLIISNNPQLAEIQQIMGNGVMLSKKVSDNPFINYFEDLDGKTNNIQYKFYDKSGNIIQ
ncbi:hypothetical protein [Sporosalibacterium faouarense]|uniref:hypothetical protein n=1 Tax=Sporosalibacterium faouarense TaxID=516123 RepID=UPI001A9C2CC4|nr:hypothetical protein [Sporosalibacterium faouarense]